MDDFSWLSGSAERIAQRLLGCELVRTFPDNWDVPSSTGSTTARVKIVETEAYDQHDAVSHSFRGETERTKTMFGPPGFLYVYFTYGMHYCCNVVTGTEGSGQGVLIRAVEPLQGSELLQHNRPGHSSGDASLTNGPAKLCQALAIDRRLNGHKLSLEPLQLIKKPALAVDNIVQTTRIGIRENQPLPLRYYLADNPWVSKK